MIHEHGNCLASFGAVTDEFDGFSILFGVLDELFELSSLDEEFNNILQVDAVIRGVPVALVESSILCFVDYFPLLRWGLSWLDASFY